MSEEIRPALSAEEWANETAASFTRSLPVRLQWAASEAGADDTVTTPALAALALQHAGPDGGAMFTWEDVDRLEWVAGLMDCSTLASVYARERTAGVRALAARLASLLPPRP